MDGNISQNKHQTPTALIPITNWKFEHCLEGVPVWAVSSEGKSILYKGIGRTISAERMENSQHPQLYIHEGDYYIVSERLQLRLNQQLLNDLQAGCIQKIVRTVMLFMQEIMTDRHIGKIDQPTLATLEQFVNYCVAEKEVVRRLKWISQSDFKTASHSLSVTALTIALCLFDGHSYEETIKIGLGSLLHDIGKVKMPADLLNAPRKLKPEEVEWMRMHVILGDELLEGCQGGITAVRRMVWEHHERLDGSGYPCGLVKANISEDGMYMGVIDTYDALTSARPYRRSPLRPKDALLVMANEVKGGRLSSQAYKALVSHLGPSPN